MKYFLLLLTLLIPGYVLSETEEDAARYYEDAQSRFHNKEYDAAILQLKNALQLAPNDLPARILLGKILLLVENGAQAEKEIRLAQRLGADPKLTLLPLAKALNQQGKYAELIEEISEFGLPYNLQVDILLQRGSAYLGMGMLPDAKIAFQSALHVQPDAFLPILGLATVLLNQGEFEEADKLVDEAASIDPDNVEVWYTKGTIAYGRGDLEQAIAFYRRALEISPDHYVARRSLATCYLDTKRYPEAVSELRILREKTEWDFQARYLLSVALKHAGDISGSKAVLNEAAGLINSVDHEILKKKPSQLLLAGLINYTNSEFERAYQYLTDYLNIYGNNPVALRLQGLTLLALGKPRPAANTLKRALEFAPDSAELWSKLGDAYLTQGLYVQAIGAYRKAERLMPGQPSLLHKLGIAHMAAKDPQAAIRELESALRNNPEATLTAMVLSALHLGAGDYQRALEIAEPLVQREPRNPTALNLLATVYMSRGRLGLAREWLNRSLAVDPTFRPARINLAKLDLRERRVAEARQALDLMLGEEPENLTLLVELAKLERSQGNLDKAVKILEKALRVDRTAIAPALHLIDYSIERGHPLAALKHAKDLAWEHPENPLVLEYLGRTQLAAGKPAEARVSLNNLSVLLGYDSRELYKVAQLQLKAGATDDAHWSLMKAVEGDPDFLQARLLLIDLQIRTGRLKDASKLIDSLDQDLKDHPAVSGLTGDLAMRRGQFEAAITAYRNSLEKDGGTNAAVGLFRARKASGDTVLAEKELEDWVETHPDSLVAKRLLAEIHHRAGRLEKARDYYEEILLSRQNDATLLNNLANIFADLGDFRSLEYARKAYELAPTDASINDTLGWLLVKSGQTEKGLKYIRYAAARNTSAPEVRYHLAVALQDLGRNGEAINELQAALKADTAFSDRGDAERRLEVLDALSD